MSEKQITEVVDLLQRCKARFEPIIKEETNILTEWFVDNTFIQLILRLLKSASLLALLVIVLQIYHAKVVLCLMIISKHLYKVVAIS